MENNSVPTGSPSPQRREPPFKYASPPPLDLPKSGGALRSLGEKFQAGGPTGTGSLRVPLPISSCRGGTGPALSLTYDSGQGQGPFGIGWSVSVPNIVRRTDKGLPRYADAEEPDIFILSGQEDFVPVLTLDGDWKHIPSTDGDYRVDAYSPRVEGVFARIERRTHTVTGEAHWRSISSDNVASVFGLSAGARIADPQDPLHVFKWQLEATFDPLGHVTFYEYKPEDLSGVSPSNVAEASRRANPPANLYLKRVHYGNRTPLTTRNPAYADIAALSWLFEVVFDYGEHTSDLPEEVVPWAIREDPFSTYRAGFEIRTYRLCQRVLMFHEIPEQLRASARLVKATELGYAPTSTVTYLTNVRSVGYAWDENDNITTAYLPTLRLDYTRVGSVSTAVQRVSERSLAQAPGGVDGRTYQFVDLDGEGIAGILTAGASPAPGLYYKRNLGGGVFASGEPLPSQPSLQSMGGDTQLMSLNADGRLDVVRLSGPTPGFFERTRSFDWAPFSTFQSLPKVDPTARGVHFLDLDGDGLTDILVAEDSVFVWYSSLSRGGFGPPSRRSQAHDEDRGAVVLTTDDYETIFLADMSGDGLSDLVRIRNGEICYWPNLGYARFGAKISMQSAPLFDTPDLFDPRRIRMGDIDGTGVTDIVYLSRRGAVVYFNEAGNGWADGIPIPLPLADVMATVRVADLLGTGTSCLVWSSVDPADARASIRYVDLLQSTKPHLLVSIVNGLGAQTTITYAPSTKFYLEDRRAGRPWATLLPFVVQTVAQVEIVDAIMLTTVVFRYRYAHGFYDGVEREFRGFARVDSWDAESMSSDRGAGVPPGSIKEANGNYNLPPVHTITWFHTGAWNGERDDLRATLSTEYYAGDVLAQVLPPTAVPSGLMPPDLREAYRSLKGRPLRQEVYAEDGTDLETAPFTVTEYRYEVRQIQPIASQRHGVYFAFEREHATYHYERNPADPRIEHKLSLEVDSLGHVVRAAHLAYARRVAAEPEQGKVLATCAATTFAAPISSLYDFRHGVITELVGYELSLAATTTVMALVDVDAAMTDATVVPFDGALAIGSMRTTDHVQHQYWADDLSGALPVGGVGTIALVYDHFALAMPATLVSTVFGANVAAGEVVSVAGYVSPDGDYWTSAGITTYDAVHFYQPTTYTDPFGNVASVVYDTLCLFVVEEHTSANPAFDNITTTTIDYRTLSPSMVTDPNGNQTAAAFDELGMVVATAVMGPVGAGEGDTLADPTTRIEYDLLAWETSQTPASVHTYAREQHGSANPGWYETYTYSDGSGHEALKKSQAQPDQSGNARWVGSGRTVFDNKGNPIKTYYPYFASDPTYDPESALVQNAYGEILCYDPLSRVIRIDYPNGTFATTEWDAWSEVRSDANDTVLNSAWYAEKSALPTSDPRNRAAALAANDANTPALNLVDPLGRTFLSIADNGSYGKYPTRTTLDIQGNQVAVTDALGNVTLQQIFDAQGNALQRASLDAGTSLALGDCLGRPYRAWDPRGYAQLRKFDPIQRLTQVLVTPPRAAQFLAEQIVYGEGLTAPNFRGRIYQHFDGAGVLTNAAYDFEGRITHTTRQLASDYKTTPSWSGLASLSAPSSFLPAAAGLLETDIFETWTTFDAMGRILTETLHDLTAIVPTYNAATLLASVEAYVQGASAATPIVTNVDYNARGQRIAVNYGKGIQTAYTYDDRTRMVMRIQTTRQSDGAALQDLNYTYDPVHNIVQITDLAQQTVYFSGTVTSGTQLYEYDPIYRITKATGREQPGQVGYSIAPNGYPDAPFANIPDPQDLQALLPYTEIYSYDAVGNIQTTVHKASTAGWTRTQTYISGSNRLNTVSMPGDPPNGPYSGLYEQDAAGNIDVTPNLATITWDQDNRLIGADLQGGGMAYFTYDSSGKRVRKIVQRSGQILERVYIGSYERYRVLSGASMTGSSVSLERFTAHIHDGLRRFAIVETKTLDVSAGNFNPTPLFRLQFPNHLGSACLETDLSGSPISYEEYYPFGGSSYRAGDMDKRYRFTGKERDEETGLYCIGLRYLSPWLGRWISPDPLSVVGGLNLYCYSENNPIRLFDASGMAPIAASQLDTTEGGIVTWADLSTQAQSNALEVSSAFSQVAERAGVALIDRAPEGFWRGAAIGVAVVEKTALDIMGGAEGAILHPISVLPNIVSSLHEAPEQLKYSYSEMLHGALAGDTPRAWMGFAIGAGAISNVASVTALATGGVRAGGAVGAAVGEGSLLQNVEWARNTVGPGVGPRYGTSVHTAFEQIGKALPRRAFEYEQSFVGGVKVPRGSGIRPDVVKNPSAISRFLYSDPVTYDLKTGSAELSSQQMASWSRNLPGPLSQGAFKEIHLDQGTTPYLITRKAAQIPILRKLGAGLVGQQRSQ
jgi:RHS repeat-associated protein